MSRARLVLLLTLTLLGGGVTHALAQEATPTPAPDCADSCEDPAAEPEGEPAEPVARGEEETAPESEQAVAEEVKTVETDPASASRSTRVKAAHVAQRAALAAADVSVEVVDFDFRPGSITISPGETVTWNFGGDQPHTVTADDGSFDSDQLTSGETFSMRFDDVGTYRYYCALHGGPGGEGMSAIVIVEGEGSSQEPPSAEEEATEVSTAENEAGQGSLPRTGGGPPPVWVFALALLFSGVVLWKVARLAESAGRR